MPVGKWCLFSFGGPRIGVCSFDLEAGKIAQAVHDLPNAEMGAHSRQPQA